MLSPYDWWLTGKVLYHLARFWPDLKNPSAPVHQLPESLQSWAEAGPYAIRTERPEWGWASLPQGLPGRAPIILFSGGAAADGTNYELLVHHWASHGFAVFEPHHGDAFSSHSARHGESWRTWKGAVWDAWGLALREPVIWRSRADDLTALLDRLPVLEEQLKIGLDSSRVAATGYSYGAQVALLLGGVGFVHRGRISSWRDERIRAALAISPEFGVRRAPRAVDRSLAIPTLFLTGDQDRDVQGYDWGSKTAGFERAPAGDKWLAVLRGANHFAFTGRLYESSRAPADLIAQRALFGASKAVSTLFLSTYLREDEGARQLLERMVRESCPLLRVWDK